MKYSKHLCIMVICIQALLLFVSEILGDEQRATKALLGLIASKMLYDWVSKELKHNAFIHLENNTYKCGKCGRILSFTGNIIRYCPYCGSKNKIVS